MIRLGIMLSMFVAGLVALAVTVYMTNRIAGQWQNEEPRLGNAALVETPARASVASYRQARAENSLPARNRDSEVAKTIETLVTPQASAEPGPQGQLYRWRDKNGAIHIQNIPPPPSVTATRIPFAQSMQWDTDSVDADHSIALVPAAANPLSVYTPEGFGDLMQRLQDTAGALHEKNREFESLKEQL